METREIHQQLLTGERALFAESGLEIYDTIFDAGESPLKESRDIRLHNSMFKWKYPLWYCEHVRADGCTWAEMARAGVWYTRDVEVNRALIEAPKNFRRCDGVRLSDVQFSNAAETLWSCRDIELADVCAKGDYFGMNCERVRAVRLTLAGNYSFDGARDVEIRDSRLISKDAFWNSERVSVYDSFISGEYLGWNARDLTFVNCTIESLQGLCYVDGLVLKNCKLLNTTLAFEYSTVDAEIIGTIDSVKNPSGGRIAADSIGELIMEEGRIQPGRTEIVCRG